MIKSLALAALIATPAMAEQMTYDEALEFCQELSKTTESLSIAKSEGFPMSEAYKVAKSEMLRNVIEYVYSKPTYRSEEIYKQQAVEVSNDVFRECAADAKVLR